jgi:ATP-dependent Lhr-like helicase
LIQISDKLKELHPKISKWFEAKNWKPFSFQTETWQHYLEGKSGLLHAPTGFGKTLSVWLGPISEVLKKEKLPNIARSSGSLLYELLLMTPSNP